MSDMYFKSLPDKSTPLIPSNLDKLNDIKVSPTEPTTNEKVWIQKGKNLVNKCFLGTGIDEQGYTFADAWTATTDFIAISPNTDYICSNSMNIANGNVFVYDKNKNFLEKINQDNILSVINTTNENARYIRVVLWKSGGINDLKWVQVEEGLIATEYEPCTHKIYIKHENGVYEEFYSEEYINGLKGTVLYSDESLTTITEALTVTLSDDLSNYKYYEVWASRFANAPGWITTGKIPVGKNAFLSSAEGGAGIYYRDIECGTSGNIMIFQKNTDGHEMRCIPRMVKGYKY